jgi:hypothetical protein
LLSFELGVAAWVKKILKSTTNNYLISSLSFKAFKRNHPWQMRWCGSIP